MNKLTNMEKIRMCSVHNRPLKQFKGVSKKTGNNYENWKCTAKVGEGYCDTIEWIDQEPRIGDSLDAKLDEINAKLQFISDQMKKEASTY